MNVNISDFKILDFGYNVFNKSKVALSALAYLLNYKTGFPTKELSNQVIQHTKIRLNGHTIQIPEVTLLLSYLDYESETQKYFLPQPEDIVIDIGANIGYYTLQIAQKVGPKGFVLAIEVNPLNYQYLQRNIYLNGYKNVITKQMAAWNQETYLDLIMSKTSEGHTVKENWANNTRRKHNFTQNKVRVKAAPIDNLVKQYQLEKVDWIKIDVEGAEFEVLQGLRNTIKAFKPKLLVESYDNQGLRKFLEHYGYTVNPIDDKIISLNNLCIIK
jgi:FkbM family methyltransferase